MTGETEHNFLLREPTEEEKRERLIEFLEKEEKKRPRLMVVDSGIGLVGSYPALSMELARIVAEKNYEVSFITPREAKEMQYPTSEKIIEVNNIIPKFDLYFPPSLVEPNRRERRKQEKLKRSKRK